MMSEELKTKALTLATVWGIIIILLLIGTLTLPYIVYIHFGSFWYALMTWLVCFCLGHLIGLLINKVIRKPTKELED